MTYFLEADLYSFVFLISKFAGSGVLLFAGAIFFCAGCVEELCNSRWRISSAEMTRGFDWCIGADILSVAAKALFCW